MGLKQILKVYISANGDRDIKNNTARFVDQCFAGSVATVCNDSEGEKDSFSK